MSPLSDVDQQLGAARCQVMRAVLRLPANRNVHADLDGHYFSAEQTAMLPLDIKIVECEQERMAATSRLKVFDNGLICAGKRRYVFMSRASPLSYRCPSFCPKSWTSHRFLFGVTAAAKAAGLGDNGAAAAMRQPASVKPTGRFQLETSSAPPFMRVSRGRGYPGRPGRAGSASATCCILNARTSSPFGLPATRREGLNSAQSHPLAKTVFSLD